MPSIGQTISYNSNFNPNTATSPISYQWEVVPSSAGVISPSPTSQNISVQWVESGTHILRLTLINGCSSVFNEQSIAVTTLPVPVTPTPTPVPVPVVPTPVPVPVVPTPIPVPVPIDVPVPQPQPIPVPVDLPQPIPVPVELPQPIPIPVEPPQPIPVPVDNGAWNLLLCSDSSLANKQVQSGNLSTGIIIKDDDTGICYTVANFNSVTFNPLVINFSEHSDCVSCMGNPQPIPIPIPVPVPVSLGCTNYQVTNDTGNSLSYQFTCCKLNSLVQDTINSGETKCICAVTGSFSSQNGEVTFTSQGSCTDSDECIFSCGGIPTPQPIPIPVPQPIPVPVGLAWNLTLCSDGSNATIQVDDINLTSGVIIKDDNTGICYTTVNLNPAIFTLMGQHSEHSDCASCIGVPIPIPVPIPVPEPIPTPIPVPEPIPVPVCNCRIFMAENSSGIDISYTFIECGTGQQLVDFLPNGSTTQGCLQSPSQFINDADGQSITNIAGVTVTDTGVNCC